MDSNLSIGSGSLIMPSDNIGIGPMCVVPWSVYKCTTNLECL